MAPSYERTGFWGPRTANIDWCEENYEVSWYVAEFYNTISNLAMILPAIYGVIVSSRNGFEKRFTMLHVMFLLVGLGFTVFHMTLKHSSQLLDEVPMIWGSCYMGYCMAMVREKPGAVSRPIAVFLTTYCVTFLVVYLIVPNPLVFQTMYGTVVVGMILQALRTLQLQHSYQVVSLYVASVLFYLAGFILWNLDNHQCPTLVYFRSYLPHSLRPLLQLHAWWHILAGYATYINIQHCLHHRLTFLQRPVVVTRACCGLALTVTQAEPNNNKIKE